MCVYIVCRKDYNGFVKISMSPTYLISEGDFKLLFCRGQMLGCNRWLFASEAWLGEFFFKYLEVGSIRELMGLADRFQ